MEKGLRTAATAVATVAEGEKYVGWQEMYVSGDKGVREIHYYLKKKDGGLDLAVVGKEKSLRHMSYRLMMNSSHSQSNLGKLRSRREVIDWLHTFLPDPSRPVSPQTSGGSMDANGSDELGVEIMKGYQVQKLGHYSKEFQWVGAPSFCRKKRKHYDAFSRNGIKISVHEFVYVLAEEDKRLVAYLDEMYEDSKGNKMVVVRWFHKIDEVGIDLPHNFNDREIFFSLCLQDLSIECIDGSATVLSPEHYAKYLKAGTTKHTQAVPFMCHRQYDNDELRPLDITQIKGYWKQEMVKTMFTRSSSKASEKPCLPNDVQKKGDDNDVIGLVKPRKRLRLARDYSKVEIQRATVNDMEIHDDVINDIAKCGFAQGTAVKVSTMDANAEAVVPFCTAAVGSAVEVLSQDSGMRGCWFRAVVIKKHKNKVKLRYNDVKDAENEANCLEEWVLASRIAARDEMGVRMHGRTTIRPVLGHNKNISCVNVGTVVDVWWHNGWWEGIVIQKEPHDRFRVYFPGEKREAVFSQTDLRQSHEWVGNTWRQVNDRPDLAASILSELDHATTTETAIVRQQSPSLVSKDTQQPDDDRAAATTTETTSTSPPIFDLSKDGFLSQLRWKTSRKRKRIYVPFGTHRTSPRRTPTRSPEKNHHSNLVVPRKLQMEKETCKSSKVDRDNCKYITESMLTTSVVPPLTSLVMSR